jgi:hypothetical protein
VQTTETAKPFFDNLAFVGELPDDRKLGHGFLVTNDRDFPTIIDGTDVLGDEAGIALFVGSGGLLSMLPDLKANIIVSVDYDPCVITFNGLAAAAVAKSTTPGDAMFAMSENWPDSLEAHAGYGHDRAILSDIQSEAFRYGSYHWSNPERFPTVKKVLGEIDWVSVVSDISDPQFTTYLNWLAEANGKGISFANLTNVHAHLLKKYDRDMDFIRDWPFEERCIILCSMIWTDEWGKTLDMTRANSAEEYLEMTKR